MTRFSLGETFDPATIKTLARQLSRHFSFRCSQCQKEFIQVYPKRYTTFVCHACKA